MRRLAVPGLVAALAVAGCGGSTAVDRPPAAPAAEPAHVAPPVPADPVAVVEPTPEQLAFRQQLLRQLKDGTYVACTCTAEIRARERIASGKVKPPPPDQLVSALP